MASGSGSRWFYYLGIKVKVSDLTRECQYCWDDERQVRVRCGRLATSFLWIRVGLRPQISFRCDGHYAKLNDTTLMGKGYKSFTVGDIDTFGLGYKP